MVCSCKRKPSAICDTKRGGGRFGHSWLTGFQLPDAACDEEERAVRKVMEII